MLYSFFFDDSDPVARSQKARARQRVRGQAMVEMALVIGILPPR